ncbi:Uncharacterised protein [Campylobacter jejuni]|nr:Uncharacterised protein [Campylobacter jejuni]
MGSKLIAAGLTFDTAAPPSQGEEQKAKPKNATDSSLSQGWSKAPLPDRHQTRIPPCGSRVHTQ